MYHRTKSPKIPRQSKKGVLRKEGSVNDKTYLVKTKVTVINKELHLMTRSLSRSPSQTLNYSLLDEVEGVW